MLKYSMDGKISFSTKLEKDCILKVLALNGFVVKSDEKWIEISSNHIYFGIKFWVEHDDLEYSECRRGKYHYDRAGYSRTNQIITDANDEVEIRANRIINSVGYVTFYPEFTRERGHFTVMLDNRKIVDWFK